LSSSASKTRCVTEDNRRKSKPPADKQSGTIAAAHRSTRRNATTRRETAQYRRAGNHQNLPTTFKEKKVKLVNLTPHVVKIFDENKNLVAEINPVAPPARVATKRVRSGALFGLIPVYSGSGALFGLIPVYSVEYGKVENLPPDDGETCYIVSAIVKAAVPDREDVFSPGELLRGEDGQPIGCIGLTQ